MNNIMLKIGDADFKEILRGNLENNIGKIRADKFINHQYDKLLEAFHKDIVDKSGYSEMVLDELFIKYWPGNKGTYGTEIFVNIDKGSAITLKFVGITAHSTGENEYRYGSYDLNEPIILEEGDWSKEEWETILKIFNMKSAEVIEIPKCCIHAFGIPN